MQVVSFEGDKVASVAELGFDPALKGMSELPPSERVNLHGHGQWSGFSSIRHAAGGDDILRYNSWTDDETDTSLDAMSFSGAEEHTAFTATGLKKESGEMAILDAQTSLSKALADKDSLLAPAVNDCFAKMEGGAALVPKLLHSAHQLEEFNRESQAGSLAKSDEELLTTLYQGLVKPSDTLATLQTRLQSAGYPVRFSRSPHPHLDVPAARQLGAIKLPPSGFYRFLFDDQGAALRSASFETNQKSGQLTPSDEVASVRHQFEMLFGSASTETEQTIDGNPPRYLVKWRTLTGANLFVLTGASKSTGPLTYTQHVLWTPSSLSEAAPQGIAP
jgi:hypothetical protein